LSTAVEAERRVSHYRIEEKVASGGMGVVYRGVDERLGRRVALKFLREVSASREEMRDLFLREARAASSLDHPNICTIFEVDETPEGQTFLVMPWYEGETLDALVRRGPLSIERALSIVIQIAKGLVAAHAEGIVHRDVKSANVIVMPRDTVKILDFGLAKLTGAFPDEAGTVAGTPAYMAPEQLRGEDVDGRADVWSVGVVLYELLAGCRPFRGDGVEAVIASVLNDEPEPLSERRPELSGKADRIVKRALAKSRAQRYERMEELVDELLAAQADLDPSGVTLRRAAVSKRTALAVLPFADMSPDRNQEYLCDGIAEEILSALRRVPDLYVASRTSAFQFKGKAVDIREIGAKLNVANVLEGSVRRVGDRVRVSAQLIGVEDGFRLWNERYDRDIKDIFAIEEEIAEKIATALQVTLTAGRRLAGAPMSARQAEAYELYLQGRQFFHHHRRKAFEIAMQSFSRAIEAEPGFARAYAGLADCNSFLRLYFGAGPEKVDAADRASLAAVELDPQQAEGHTSRGLALFLRGELGPAERELSRAVAIDPLLYEAHYIHGRVCFSEGRIADAAAHFREASSIAPEAFDSWYLLGMCYRRAGEPERARGADLECIEAVNRRIRVHPDDTRAWTMGASVFAELGEPARAAAWVGRALAIDPDEPIILYNAACVYVALGMHDEAISCLETPIRQLALSPSWVENDPDLDPIRKDPRFRALLEEAAAGTIPP